MEDDADASTDNSREGLLGDGEKHKGHRSVPKGGWWGKPVVGGFNRWDAAVILMTFGVSWEQVRDDLDLKPLTCWDAVGMLFYGPFWLSSIRDRPGANEQTRLWAWKNMAIPLCYSMVGVFQGLSSASMNFYPIEIGATEAQQITIKSLRGLPASFKIFFGFLSDTMPLFGYRRKVYMIIGWILASFAAFMLAVSPSPSIPYLASMYLLYGFGFWLADVMGDSLVAERAKLEPEEHRGQLQSTCYACRFYWMMVMICAAIGAYELFTPLFVFWLLFALPLVIMIPAIIVLAEERGVQVAPVKEQAGAIFSTVSNRAVWQPMSFVYIFNVLQVSNAAWNQFLVTVKGFTSLQLNSFLIPAYIMLFLGIAAYKAYMIHWSWRFVYIITTVIGGFFSFLQFVLIFGWNEALGIGDYVFALGDDVFLEFILGVQFLPTTIMMVHLCPAGSEGAAYAMFTTMNNSALGVATTISSLLVFIWDVDEETLESGDVSGMWKLSLLTTCLQLSGLLFVGLLPRSKEGLTELDKGYPPSRVGGIIFLAVVFISVAWSLVTAVLNIVDPDWVGG